MSNPHEVGILIPDDLSIADQDRLRYASDAPLRAIPRETFDQILYFLAHPETGVRRDRPQRIEEDK